jgi:hypothetical protein
VTTTDERARAEIERRRDTAWTVRVMADGYKSVVQDARTVGYLIVMRDILDRHAYRMDGWHIYDEEHPVCVACKMQDWPCPDVRAVYEALGVTDESI